MRYLVEGQDLEPFFNANGTGKNFTLSFYVKAYQAGTYQLNIYKQDGPRFITKTYTIASSGVWQRVVLNFTGDTNTSGMVQTTGSGFNIAWIFAAGTNYTSGSQSTNWGGWPGNAGFAAGHAVNSASSANNYFRITGVQLELGDIATPFEHRSVGDELRRCYRYFQRRTSSDNYQWVSLVAFYSGSEIHGFFDHYEPMRASPTLSADTGSNTLAVQRAGGYIAWSTGIVKNGGNLNVTYFYRDGVSLGTSGQSGRVLTWTSGCTITLSAEL